MTFLKIENVHKQFCGFHALQGINLNVERGETIAVIGPSGCGKTTLLRCISLLETIDRGLISLDGKPVSSAGNNSATEIKVDANKYRMRVGMVFQHLNIWPHRTVLANLMLAPIVLRKLSGNEAKRRAYELLERMDIAEKAEQYPHSLSGGQLQRTALARALMMNPDILMLDEITSALDPELVGEVLDVIAALTMNGMTMIIVTHEMYFAAEVADRVVFMDEGAIVETGEPKELFSKPRTERLQAFLQIISRHRSKGVLNG